MALAYANGGFDGMLYFLREHQSLFNNQYFNSKVETSLLFRRLNFGFLS